MAEHLRAFPLGRVTGANGDPQLRFQACERPAEVALDVVVERLQRRDVEEAEPPAGLGVEPVDPVEEGGERLPGAGRSLDERVLAACDRRPAEGLRGRRRLERVLEPGPRFRAEDGDRKSTRLHSSHVKISYAVFCLKK